MSLPRPPADWRDVPGWDSYWKQVVARRIPDRYDPYVTPFDAYTVTNHVVRLVRRGSQRILFVGNGISLLPRAFAHAGFDVVALDVSRVATEYGFAYVPSSAEMALFFQLDEGDNRGNFVDRYHRPGGHVVYSCGDLFDDGVEPGPFDLIWSSASLQGFAVGDLVRAIGALDRRLAAGGECHVRIVNAPGVLERIRDEFARLGYEVNPDVDDAPGKRLSIQRSTG